MRAISADVDPLLRSWMRSLNAAGKSPKTIDSYRLSVQQLTVWCQKNGRPTAPDDQERGDVEDFIVHVRETRSPGTAGVRYRSLKQWFRWLDEEDEADDITAGMKHPKVPTPVVPVIPEDDLRALLEVTKGREFKQRRDHAIFRVLIDTGMRRGELVGLTRADVDLDTGVLLVRRSKTGTGRLVPVGPKTVAALDRYERARAQHRHADAGEFWLGLHGPIAPGGVQQMMTARCREAGITEHNLHRFRHTAAHRWLAAGGQEQDLARIAGWTPGSVMLSRYGASAASERAREAHRRIAPGESL